MLLAEEWSSACGANTLSPCAPLLWLVLDVRQQRHQIPAPGALVTAVQCTIPQTQKLASLH